MCRQQTTRPVWHRGEQQWVTSCNAHCGGRDMIDYSETLRTCRNLTFRKKTYLKENRTRLSQQNAMQKLYLQHKATKPAQYWILLASTRWKIGSSHLLCVELHPKAKKVDTESHCTVEPRSYNETQLHRLRKRQ